MGTESSTVLDEDDVREKLKRIMDASFDTLWNFSQEKISRFAVGVFCGCYWSNRGGNETKGRM